MPDLSSKPLRRALELALFLLLAWAIVAWQTRNMLETGRDTRMPPLQLHRLDGGVATIAPDPRRDTLLYFFAPWCGICRATIGHLDAVDTARTQVAVIALDYENLESVRAFVDDTGLPYPVHLGTPRTRELFRVQAYPTYYVLDSEFRVTGRSMGALTAVGLHLR